MTRTSLLAAAAAAALSASPAQARPMTATDMHMMRRLGAPEVSRDGHWAVFTISDTDLDKNKRNNRLYLLDLTRPGSAPQPIAAAAKGHDAVFGPDNAIWFLMGVEDQDQLFRMSVGGAPLRISDFKGDIGGFKLAPSGNEMVVWADRDLRCLDLNCADLPDKPETGSARIYDQLFVRHWDTWATPGVKSRLFGFAVAGGKLAGAGVPLTGNLVGDTPSKPFGGGEELSFSPDGKTLYFAHARGGADRALVDQPRHLRDPERRQRAAGQPDRRQRRHRQPADRFAGRANARVFRDGAARATRPTARC